MRHAREGLETSKKVETIPGEDLSKMSNATRKTVPARPKRTNKPIIEKKRRDRINTCLDQLKVFLISNKSSKLVVSPHKLEKADILELTVEYIKNLKNVTTTESPNCTEDASSYISGYVSCMEETKRQFEKDTSVSSLQIWQILADFKRSRESLNVPIPVNVKNHPLKSSASTEEIYPQERKSYCACTTEPTMKRTPEFPPSSSRFSRNPNLSRDIFTVTEEQKTYSSMKNEQNPHFKFGQRKDSGKRSNTIGNSSFPDNMKLIKQNSDDQGHMNTTKKHSHFQNYPRYVNYETQNTVWRPW